MKNEELRRGLYILLLCLVTAIGARAQKLIGEAKSQVAVGEQFRLTYTIDTQDASDFRAGQIPNELDILMGPSTSRQSSYQIINGKTSSSSSITFTYIVAATAEGTFTIPPAQVTVDGQTIKSNTLTIKVSGQVPSGYQGGGQSNSRRGGGSQQQQPTMRDAGSQITASDLFIRVSANKKRVHEQEPILLTYKVYTLVDLTQLAGKMPDLKGFHSQEVQLPQQKSFSVETVDGKSYRTVTWSQYVMFPQMTGDLEIPSITFDGVVVQRNRSVDPFEAFFNGGSGYIEVKKKIVAPGLKVHVDPLPTRPAGFSGAVGQDFSISAQIDKTATTTNDPLTLRVIVSGSGNLKLVKQPVVEFPKDFDKYDAKVTDKTKLTSNGVEGSMVYEFMAVPRHAGKFEIPPIEFTYYDTKTNSYKTAKTDGFTIDVAKGEGSSSAIDYSQTDVSILNNDIRYIKTGSADRHAINDFFFGSPFYWIALAVLVLIFIALFIVFRQRAIDNANIGKMRGKKANKVATKRLRTARHIMTANKPSQFYDEVLRALWGYVGDKLNMPVESLSRDNISQRLADRGVAEATVKLFIEALDECEFERYAPGDAKGNMNKTFNAAMTAIMNIEDTMKKRPRKSAPSATLPLLLLCFSMSVSAQDTDSIMQDVGTEHIHDLMLEQHNKVASKSAADSAYTEQRYQDAIALYEQLLTEGVNSDLYYNLGNAYYRTDNITRAVINYERALLLSPGDKDIRYNLQLARSMTIDKINPESEMFFVTWYHSLINLMSVDGWAKTALVTLAIAILLALCYLFSDRMWLRKLGFFGCVIMIFVFIFSNIFAAQQKDEFINRKGAIVVAPSTQIKSTPADNGTDLFILHEGTKVTIIDGSMEGWKEIRVDDGKEGWIETSAIEII